MGIKLRSKKNKSGSTSYYIDIHYQGQRWTEAFGEVIPKDAPTKDRNRIKQMVDTWYSQRKVDFTYGNLDMPGVYSVAELVAPYLTALADKKTNAGAEAEKAAITKFTDMLGPAARWRDIKDTCLQTFADHLVSDKFARTSIVAYCGYVRRALRKAHIDMKLKLDPQTFKFTYKGGMLPVEKDDLTEEEIILLSQTPCDQPDIAIAFLFCCYTGLSFTDMVFLEKQHIKYEVIEQTGIYLLQKYRHKSNERVEVALSPSALNLLQQARPYGKYVFDFMGRFDPADHEHDRKLLTEKLKGAYARVRYHLRLWVKAAGINKNINWHNARHSLATNLGDKIDAQTLGGIMGWSPKTAALMAARYSHRRQDRQIAAINSLKPIPLPERVE